MKRVLAQAAVTVLACAAVGVWSYRTGHASGAAKVQAKRDAERAAHARALIAAIEERDRATAAMAARTEALKREYKRETDRIAADRDRLLASLRDRPDAPSPSSVSGDTGSGIEPSGWCTGAQLYRDHAEAFAGEAALASQLQAALGTCISAYDEVRRSMTEKK